MLKLFIFVVMCCVFPPGNTFKIILATYDRDIKLTTLRVEIHNRYGLTHIWVPWPVPV